MDSRRKLLFSLFSVFFKIGAFTWGGGYVMLPLIRNEVIQKRKWIDMEEFIDGIAIAQSAPGAIAINTATFVGNRMAGTAGAIISVLGATLPSYIAIVVVALFFLRFEELTIVQNFFRGATPAVLALIVSAIIDFGRQTLKKRWNIVISIVFMFLLIFLHLHPVIIIVIAGILGLFIGEKS